MLREHPNRVPAVARRRWCGVPLAAAVLGLALTALAQPAVTVTRLLPACQVVNELRFEAELVVDIAGPSPAALIVEEQVPTGWTVEAAAWIHGGLNEPLPTIQAAGKCRWLFDPLGFPVDNGLIRLTLTIPPPGVGSHTIEGSAKWFATQAEAGCTVDSQKELSVATLHAGWNALSLPSGVADRNALDEAFSDAAGGPLLYGPVYVWNAVTGAYDAQPDGCLEAGQGFLGCIMAGGEMHLLVAAAPGGDLALSPGWNFKGVCRAISLHDLRALTPAVGTVRRWDAMLEAYLPLSEETVLLPGCGYWLYLQGSEAVVIPLEPSR